MTDYTVTAEQLTTGSPVFIRGVLGYARLTRPIEGEELAASDRRKIQNGMNPVQRPHTTATITRSEVQFANPDQPTVEEQFVSERRYSSKKNPDSGANYSIDSKGTTLPVIAVPSESKPGTFDQDKSGRELSTGLDVTLVLRVYKPKNYAKHGLALDKVIVNETPRYYSASTGVDTAELAARGIVFNTPPKSVAAEGTGAVGGVPTVSAGAEEELPVPQPQATPQPQPQPQPEPQPPAAVSGETMEQKLARLEAENAALKDAGSAVGTPVAAGAINPWDEPGQPSTAGITFHN